MTASEHQAKRTAAMELFRQRLFMVAGGYSDPRNRRHIADGQTPR